MTRIPRITRMGKSAADDPYGRQRLHSLLALREMA
jgi:hypothetical protein